MSAMTSKVKSTGAANALISFINASPTAWHAVHNAAALLESAGFRRVEEGSNWEKDLAGGSKVFYTRNQSTLLAFTVPKAGFKPGTGVSVVATHTDSPNLRVRPISKRSKVGYLQVGVETYGGGIWHSWFDRDLSLAGRVVVSSQSSGSSDPSTKDKDTRTIDSHKYTSQLIKIKRPILRIPTLAIHLDRGVNDNFKFNNETEFIPILGLISSQLNAGKPAVVNTKDDSDDDDKKPTVGSGSGSVVANNHHPGLLDLLAQELGVGVEAIQDFELALYDTQPSCLGGLNNEFIFSPRLDNLMSTFSAVEALIRSSSENSIQELEGNINAIVCFNHEEVGSVSSTGAESSMLPNFLSRLSPTPSEHAATVGRSFLISADVGHAVHPNYTSKHEENHRPVMNGGIALKTNAKQRYTTDAWGSFLIRKLVERKGGNVQEFSSRNDMPCGSTVGPMLSKIGVRTVDVGMPILSMHSCRETGGAHDVQRCIDLFQSFFEGFATLDKDLQVV
ncbi:hypothetical protein FRB95_013842 [Tulasnella sp. JGI-2019a]|nr:hypothetical protein FRB93_007452 [Tulasnella sp. JGI-2019a]KAG9034073.1 hypothetical protein FRB95_013842 [Tulasnella sp. JGI-2019a]